jgi:hypothetical protein
MSDLPVPPENRPSVEVRERRVWIRYPADAEMTCHPALASNRSRWAARIRNISHQGILLLVSRPFEPRSLLRIESPVGGENAVPPAIFARVVHTRREGFGRWSVGCAFARELTDEELALFRAGSGRTGRRTNAG